MEIPNVNNLNGIPNFGHGLPSEITDTTQYEEVASEGEESNARVQDGEAAFGEQAGAESEVAETGDSDSTESSEAQ